MKFLSLLMVGMCVTSLAFSQKVKYKDLYVLLETKDYERAEPFLRTYLTQEPDDGNANLQMGFILEDKANNSDILKETERLVELSDSAVLYYNKANQYIDEKEVKKHDEYYKDYYRRDLRTGKYGVKLADVKFDIEKRITALSTSSKNANAIKESFLDMEAKYAECVNQYKALEADFGTYNMMLFNSSDDLKERLTTLSATYEAMNESYTTYKELIADVQNAGYNQNITETDIEGFVNTEEHNPDFYNNDIQLYAFNKWVDNSNQKIDKEVTILMSGLGSYRNSLEEIRKKAISDGMIVDPEKTGISSDVLINKLKSYEEDPFPQYLFDYKKSEITYYSSMNKIDLENDSISYFEKGRILQELMSSHESMKTSYNDLKSKVDTDGYGLYTKLLMDDPEANDMTIFMTSGNEFVIEQGVKVRQLWDDYLNSTLWAIHEEDSIPLRVPETLVQALEGEQEYISYALDTLSDDELVVTGFHRNEKGFEGFVSVVGGDLMVNRFATIDFEEETTADSLVSINCFSRLVENDSTSQLVSAFVNIDGFNNEYPSRIVKSDSTGVVMNKFYNWEKPPVSFAIKQEDGSLQVFLSEEEEDAQYVSLDKEGNQVN